MNLLVWAVASLAWRWTHLWRAPARGGPRRAPSAASSCARPARPAWPWPATASFGGGWRPTADPDIIRLELSFPDLPPGLDGLRLVQISDLHAGPLVEAWQVQRWRRLAEGERPEAAGGHRRHGGQPARRGAASWPTPSGISGPPWASTPSWATTTTSPTPGPSGGTLGHRLPVPGEPARPGGRKGGTLALVGLQDPMARHGHFRDIVYGPGPQPDLAVQGIPAGAWRLCLSHRPSDWHLARRTGAPLTLSGHTHGGQVNLIPGVSSAILLGEYTQGLYREDGQSLYVNRGLGVVGLPMRVGAPPEITVITLRRG